MLQVTEPMIKARMDGLFCRIDVPTGRTICRRVPLDFIPSYIQPQTKNLNANSARLQSLILSICKLENVSIDDLRSTSRADDLVIARQLAVWVARQKLNLSFETIGLAINRHHTTAMDLFISMRKNIRKHTKQISAIYADLGMSK